MIDTKVQRGHPHVLAGCREPGGRGGGRDSEHPLHPLQWQWLTAAEWVRDPQVYWERRIWWCHQSECTYDVIRVSARVMSSKWVHIWCHQSECTCNVIKVSAHMMSSKWVYDFHLEFHRDLPLVLLCLTYTLHHLYVDVTLIYIWHSLIDTQTSLSILMTASLTPCCGRKQVSWS